jgi:DNA polymerase-3 subunit alpha
VIFADFKQDCFSRLDKKGLGENKEYTKRLNEELAIIEAQIEDYKTNILDYFYSVAEQTKKSGKVENTNNLLVTYLLDITDQDPVALKKDPIKTKSAEFPDIDMDFEDAKRDLVKEYVIEKYGKENVASIAAFGRMQAKAVIKDISRVKGIPHEEVNEATKAMKFSDTLEDAYNLRDGVKKFFDKYSYMDLFGLCKKLQGNVRHLSQHAAGVVIAPSNIMNFCGLEKAKDKIVTCFEEAGGSKELSKLGLVKMDFLGLNTLTVLHDAVKFVKKNHGKDIDLWDIDIYDKALMEEFAKGNTVGIFQFERDWVRMMLHRMQGIEFKDIVTLNALNRPGPIEMGEKLWKTKTGNIPYSYIHPSLEKFLKETYCVIVYQEQVMEIAQALSGFSADEADNFRKAMSSGKADIAKGFNPFVKHEKRFIDGCRKRGMKDRVPVTRIVYSDSDIPTTAQDVNTVETGVDDKGLPFRKITCTVEASDELFYQIKSFAEYGFNKAHAVEYSQLAVYCMYFKHYYPIEFVASILSNTPNAVNQNDKSNKFVDYFFEAKKMKIKVLPPDINESEIRFTPKSDHVLSGFNFIKDLGEDAMNAIIKKRPFNNFRDFVSKVSTKEVNKSSMLALIHSGCFDRFLDINGDKNKLSLRYDLIQQYVSMRKVKDLDYPMNPTAVDAILEESEYCGDQIFNSLIDLIDKEAVSAKYSIDDKIMPFSALEKMNVGTTIRVFGVVNSWFVKKNQLTGNSVGFLNVKNGSKLGRFICWSNDIDKIERVDALKAMLRPKSVITFRVRRERDYKEEKSFLLILDGMEKLL